VLFRLLGYTSEQFSFPPEKLRTGLFGVSRHGPQGEAEVKAESDPIDENNTEDQINSEDKNDNRDNNN
jgi:hypothetical protein